MAEVSFTKRAAAELSRCFNGLAVRAKASTSSRKPVRDFWAALQRPKTAAELLRDSDFLCRLFRYVHGRERTSLALVCRSWRDALYMDACLWKGFTGVVRCREARCEPIQVRRRHYESLERRGLDSVSIIGSNDEDILDFISNAPPTFLRGRIRQLGLRCSSLSDKTLETLLAATPRVTSLELFGCNEITDAGLWASLTPVVTCLTLADCINVADDTLAAVAQLLPGLQELNLQAYHVTDAALAYLGPRQGATLAVLRLRSCWELTNHGLLNVAHALPHLVELSLSGCSKIGDDGVELLAENLRQLRILDLSWCPRVTDASLEFIACDLAQLEQLTLDRCMHITDIGLGYLSTIGNLSVLYLRWCSQIRDFGLQHLCSMKNLKILSLVALN
ncbi:F-box/LRR-repeat protein 16-like isoform X2 [Ornithodoros turicata]|uniref:F-box/LRR-repeat protein 16-like isoform X2 n=1 Tax=Ornithodoros turicata TaxID=34597 RepID=UPI0031389E4F